MKHLSKFFLGVLLLTVASVSWAACPEGTKNNYKGECVTAGDSKWMIVCGLADEEAYRVEGSKHIFKLDNGDVGRCSTDSKGYKYEDLEFDHSERQEIKSKKAYNKGKYKFSALVTISGASQWRSTILQFADSPKKGTPLWDTAPASWFGFDGHWWFRTSDRTGMKKNLRITLGQPFQFEAIFWFPNEKTLSVDYFIDGGLIAQHHNRKLNRSLNVKFGIYRILSEGTTTFIYDNPVIERLDWTDSGKMIGKSWPAQPDPWIWCVTPDAWDTLKESDCKARDGESFDTMEEAFAEYQQLQQK